MVVKPDRALSSDWTRLTKVKFGYLTLNHSEGILPADLGPELEQRGFDSIWVPEHSHIPVSRQTPYPGGGELPDGYWHNMDPFVSLTSAAAATENLLLYTGVCLLLEHDLLDLACTTATLDVIAQGRLRLGIGVGWNEEELANHRPDIPFSKRYSAMKQRVQALRLIWAEDEPSYSGTWDSFTKSWVYPKPVNRSIPVAMGNAGPVGIDHVAAYGDEWCPIDASLAVGEGGVKGGFDQFWAKLEAADRDPAGVPVTIFMMAPKADRIAQYAELGAERVVFFPPTMHRHNADATLEYLDQLQDVIGSYQ